MWEQSEDDVANGVLRIKLGGEEKVLPVLSISDSELWQRSFAKRLGSGLDAVQPGENGEVIASIASVASATAVELVAEYDITHALGRNKAALRKSLNQRQAFEILKAITRVEFPLAEGALPVILEMLRPGLSRLIDRLLLARFTSSPSPDGEDSTPEVSDSDSPADS